MVVDNIRFSEFEFALPTDPLKDKIQLKMKGEAASLAALAYQSDVINESVKLVDANLSELMIGDKGIVGFGFSATIPVDKIYYKNKFIVGTTTNQ